MKPEEVRYVWLFVFFDLPVGTKPERRAATRFRNFLKDDGFHAVEEIDRTLHTVSGLSLEFNRLISCFFLEESYFTRRNGAFLRNVKREGIAV